MSIVSICKTAYEFVKDETYNKLMGNEEASKNSVIDIALTVFIVAAIIPSALIALNGANTSGFDAGQLALYGIIGLVALIAVVMGILKFVKK